MKSPILGLIAGILLGIPVVRAGAEKPAADNLDWSKFPANTWVPVKPVTVQPESPDERGRFLNAGFNKLVYDAKNQRALFYDRWIDKKHGGYTIYGNCLFAFDPARQQVTPLRFTNWTRQVPGRNYKYKTVALPENEKDPTPCDRHVYDAFAYAPELDALFIANGANRGVEAGDKIGHSICNDTWRLDLATRKWARVESKEHPPSQHESGMDWCPETKSIVYAGQKDIWILDVASGQWRKAKTALPEGHMGVTVTYDAPRKRMLIAGGGGWNKSAKKGNGFEMLYAFDPKEETLKRLADCPTAMNRTSLAQDTKRDRFFLAIKMPEGSENPSGVFGYDPAADKWTEVKATNELPLGKSWDAQPMPLCYDAEHDCLLGMAGDGFHAFRYAPGEDPGSATGQKQKQEKAAGE
jgi:hypothetical protein